MNRQETTAILRILRTVWPNEQITEDRITAYQWALEDRAYPDVEDAAKQWLRTGKFFPKPAELLEILSVQDVAPELVPEVAWGEVLREASRVGQHGIPTWSNPLIGQACRSIGWREICLSDERYYPTLRAQFREALKALYGRAIRDEQIGQVGASGPALAPGASPALADRVVSR
jgi:hypothetical protein